MGRKVSEKSKHFISAFFFLRKLFPAPPPTEIIILYINVKMKQYISFQVKQNIAVNLNYLKMMLLYFFQVNKKCSFWDSVKQNIFLFTSSAFTKNQLFTLLCCEGIIVSQVLLCLLFSGAAPRQCFSLFSLSCSHSSLFEASWLHCIRVFVCVLPWLAFYL